MRKKQLVSDETKNRTFLFLQKWANTRTQDYNEPERKGATKGDPIGFSKKKMYTAIIMALTPAFSLQDISEITDVPETTLKVWRSQNLFKLITEIELNELGIYIANLIILIIHSNIINQRFLKIQYSPFILRYYEGYINDSFNEIDCYIKDLGNSSYAIYLPILNSIKRQDVYPTFIDELSHTDDKYDRLDKLTNLFSIISCFNNRCIMKMISTIRDILTQGVIIRPKYFEILDILEHGPLENNRLASRSLNLWLGSDLQSQMLDDEEPGMKTKTSLVIDALKQAIGNYEARRRYL